MTKETGDKSRQRLQKARRKLSDLESALKKAERKGEERVRLAREQADKRIAKARTRVEEQAEVVARRESAVAEASPQAAAGPDIHSPEMAADVVEQAVAESGLDGMDGQGIVLDGSMQISERETEQP